MRLPRALIACALLGAACAAREEAPDTVVRAFARAVVDHDEDRAWALLSSDTRQWLDARAQAVAAAAPGVIAPSGAQLLLGNAARSSRPPKNVVVVRESRDRAVVEVEEESGVKRRVELVREQGWRVRIPPPH